MMKWRRNIKNSFELFGKPMEKVLQSLKRSWQSKRKYPLFSIWATRMTAMPMILWAGQMAW